MTKEDIAQEVTKLNDLSKALELSNGRWNSTDMMDHIQYWSKRGRVYGVGTQNNITISNTIVEAQAQVNKPHFDVNKRFHFMETLVRMIANGSQKSMFICGDGGLGKTKTVLDTLEETEADYVMVKGSSTAKGLYCKLRDNAESIIVFDDCDDVFKIAKAANILKSATDSYERRIVSWVKDSNGIDDEENEFEFTGRIIFISNLPVSAFPQALQSRSTVVDLGMTTDEKIERIEFVLEKLDIATMLEKEEALNMLKDNRDRIKDINFRTVIKFAGFFEEMGINEESKELCLFTGC